jgi:hypothetical protein
MRSVGASDRFWSKPEFALSALFAEEPGRDFFSLSVGFVINIPDL